MKGGAFKLDEEGTCELCPNSGPLWKLPWGPPPVVCEACARKHGYLPPAIWDLVIADMQSRDAIGVQEYKVRLTAHDGRNGLRDAYEEILDLAVYLRKLIYESEGS